VGGLDPLRLLGALPEDLPPSPGAELLLFLAARPGWREVEEIRRVVPTLARAIEQVNQSPYADFLEAEGTRLRLNRESDLVAYWQEAFRDLDRLRALYGELAPGFESPIPEFRAWLDSERKELLRALWATAVGRAGMLLDTHREDEALALLLEMEKAYPLEPRSALDLADLYWRLRRPEAVVRVLEAVLPELPEELRPRAERVLAEALLRAGRTEEGRERLAALLARGGPEALYALLALGGLEALSGEAELALSRAREARRQAEEAGEAEALLRALLLEGEALLRLGRAKEAATGPLPAAMGLQELLHRSFSAESLAILAEAQARWGKGRARARELAEKAYRRAVQERNPYAASRALYAWAVAAEDPEKLEAARRQAELAGHAPWQAFLDRAGLEDPGDPA